MNFIKCILVLITNFFLGIALLILLMYLCGESMYAIYESIILNGQKYVGETKGQMMTNMAEYILLFIYITIFVVEFLLLKKIKSK